MKKIIFVLAMFLSPTLFAATLTTNTVPYVCQGGATPQLCNSKVTTDNNGNILSGGLGAWVSRSVNTSYQEATEDLFFLPVMVQGVEVIHTLQSLQTEIIPQQLKEVEMR